MNLYTGLIFYMLFVLALIFCHLSLILIMVMTVFGCLFSNHKVTGMGFPGGLHSKESACNAGGPDLTPGSGRCSGEGNHKVI